MDQLIAEIVKGVVETITLPSLINLDFADAQTIMRNAGPAWMSIGFGEGEDRVKKAAQQAISNPLLDVTIDGATGVLFNITGGSDLKLSEVHQAAEELQRVIHPDANIIFGMTTDLKMENEIKLTVIATGFENPETEVMTDSELKEMLMTTMSDGAIDVPPFLRRLARSNGPSVSRQLTFDQVEA